MTKPPVAARARLLAVVAIVATGALGIIASTQIWLFVTLSQTPGDPLAVPGASAVPVLAPLSLAALALGAALSIVGLVLRYVFGVLAVAIGGTLVWLTWNLLTAHPTSAIAAAVTEATGITGQDAVADLVAATSATAWPILTLVGWIVLVAAGLFVLATARGWRRSGRKYETDAAAAAPAADSAPLDAISSWDDLSRGQDPTD